MLGVKKSLLLLLVLGMVASSYSAYTGSPWNMFPSRDAEEEGDHSEEDHDHSEEDHDHHHGADHARSEEKRYVYLPK